LRSILQGQYLPYIVFLLKTISQLPDLVRRPDRSKGWKSAVIYRSSRETRSIEGAFIVGQILAKYPARIIPAIHRVPFEDHQSTTRSGQETRSIKGLEICGHLSIQSGFRLIEGAFIVGRVLAKYPARTISANHRVPFEDHQSTTRSGQETRSIE